jgi:hypothetical protein
MLRTRPQPVRRRRRNGFAAAFGRNMWPKVRFVARSFVSHDRAQRAQLLGCWSNGPIFLYSLGLFDITRRQVDVVCRKNEFGGCSGACNRTPGASKLAAVFV